MSSSAAVANVAPVEVKGDWEDDKSAPKMEPKIDPKKVEPKKLEPAKKY